MLNDTDRRFLTDRTRRNRFARPAMLVVAVLWCGSWAVLFFKVPLLANPFHLMERVRANDLAPGTLALLAAMTSLLFTLVEGVVLALLVCLLGWIRLERRYLRVTQQLIGNEETGS